MLITPSHHTTRAMESVVTYLQHIIRQNFDGEVED